MPRGKVSQQAGLEKYRGNKSGLHLPSWLVVVSLKIKTLTPGGGAGAGAVGGAVQPALVIPCSYLPPDC
jgi:hypothetical protein